MGEAIKAKPMIWKRQTKDRLINRPDSPGREKTGGKQMDIRVLPYTTIVGKHHFISILINTKQPLCNTKALHHHRLLVMNVTPFLELA